MYAIFSVSARNEGILSSSGSYCNKTVLPLSSERSLVPSSKELVSKKSMEYSVSVSPKKSKPALKSSISVSGSELQ